MGNSQTSKKPKCLTFFLRKLFKSKFLRLIGAIKTGNLTLVKYYHSGKVNFTRYMDNGDTPLHVAVKYNRTEIAKFICENQPNLNLNDRNFIGDTPLLIASMNGNFELVRYLVTHNADPNLRENRGFTAFIAACANGDIDIVKFLVNRGGADFKLKAHDGQTGLHRAAFYGNYDVLVYLVRDLKMNVMVPDRKGNIPLHLACMKVNIKCVRALIKASNKDSGASLQLKNKYGVSPLDILVKQFNRLREPDEDEEIRPEEVEEYLRDKHKYPRRKIVPPSPDPSSHRRASGLGHATDLKKKFKDFFNRNSLFGSGDSAQQSAEQEHSMNIRPNNLSEQLFPTDEITSPIPHDEEGMDGLTEDQRNPGSETRLLSPRLLSPGRKPAGVLGIGNHRKVVAQTKAAGLFASKLSGIRRMERSPSTVVTTESRLSILTEPKSNPKVMKRSASGINPLMLEETKPVPSSHFATRTKSRFAGQNG